MVHVVRYLSCLVECITYAKIMHILQLCITHSLFVRDVMYHTRTAHAFSEGNKYRHYICVHILLQAECGSLATEYRVHQTRSVK